MSELSRQDIFAPHMVDCNGYNLSTYELAILVHIYNSLINMGCLHILLHI
jgi:hypothetical protein